MLYNCAFCDPKNYEKRIFWEDKDKNWCAFLSSGPITRGHSILLFVPHRNGLVGAVDDDAVMKELPEKLKFVTKILHRVYQSPIMMASMNLGESHFHIHLYPAHMEEEIEPWWKRRGFNSGHMLAFLGEKESVISEFTSQVWDKSFSVSIHEAADNFIKNLEVLRQATNEITKPNE